MISILANLLRLVFVTQDGVHCGEFSSYFWRESMFVYCGMECFINVSRVELTDLAVQVLSTLTDFLPAWSISYWKSGMKSSTIIMNLRVLSVCQLLSRVFWSMVVRCTHIYDYHVFLQNWSCFIMQYHSLSLAVFPPLKSALLKLAWLWQLSFSAGVSISVLHNQ